MSNSWMHSRQWKMISPSMVLQLCPILLIVYIVMGVQIVLTYWDTSLSCFFFFYLSHNFAPSGICHMCRVSLHAYDLHMYPWPTWTWCSDPAGNVGKPVLWMVTQMLMRGLYVHSLFHVPNGFAYCSGSAGASVVAHSVALPLIEIAFSTLDCSIVPTCGAWGSATAAKHGPLKQSWAGIQHSRDGEPLGVLMQLRNVRVNGFFFFSSLGVLHGVLVHTLSLCSGNFCVECVLIVLHKFYIELYKKYNWLDPGPSMRFDEIIMLFCNKCW